MIRTLWVAIHVVLATVPLSIVVIVSSLLRVDSSLYDRIPRLWARWLLWASGVRLEVSGLEHFDPTRPQIVAANHSSWFDVLALAAIIPKRYRFVAKKELASVPLWGRAWKAAGHISLDRSATSSAVAALEQAGALVRSDNSAVVIYPEGTRSPDGRLQPFKKGAFMLALQTHIDVIPASVQGAFHVMNRHSWRVRSGRIIVRFGPPINTTQYDVAHRDQLMARVRSEIEKLLTPARTD